MGTVSAIDVSSTYFQMGTFGALRSLIINKKSQGPSLVPWGTPEGGQTPNQREATSGKLYALVSICKKVSDPVFDPAGDIQT